jgi:hypothetical protein
VLAEPLDLRAERHFRYSPPGALEPRVDVEQAVGHAADARYYASAERRSVEPDPARHIVSSESRMLREVPQ